MTIAFNPVKMNAPDLNHDREAELLRLAAQGDAGAFEQLLLPLQRPMYGYAVRLCGDAHLAEDLCQDAFIKAFRAIGSFTGKSALSTWMYRILHNTWLDYVKKSTRQAIDLSDAAPEGDYEEAPQISREAVFRYFEQMRGESARELVEEALAALSPALRDVVILRDIKGCAYDEIVEITGLAIGTVKSRIARGRARLREVLSAPAADQPSQNNNKKLTLTEL